MNSERVLTHLIKAGRDTLHLERTLNDLGYTETPFFSIHGDIADAIYHLLGEDTQTFEESETCAALHDIYSSDEICAQRLAERMHSQQNCIVIPDKIRKMLEEAAGERNIDCNQLINAILTEWAAQRMFFKTRAVS